MPDVLSFPYPVLGATARAKGQGCTICVHQGYCPALYWFKRYTQPEQEETNGIQCASWSSNIADQVTTISDYDIAENERRSIAEVLEEANRNGMTDPTTAGIWKHDAKL